MDKQFAPSIKDIKYVMQMTMLSEKAVKGFWSLHPTLTKEELSKLINDGQPKIRVLHA